MISHWFDPGASGESYSARIRLTGHRVGIGGKPGPRDTFVQDETVADIVPGSGRMSISTWIYGEEQHSIGSSLLVSVLALVAGLIAAKIWYAILHPGPWRQSLAGGWSVDGFLIVAPVVAISALLILSLPIGAFLDSVTPGMFFAVAIGRLGCFLTGCCAGRCTRSRWGCGRRIAELAPGEFLHSCWNPSPACSSVQPPPFSS